MDSFDVVIVGAGPTGLACGIELKKRGVRAVLIDKGCVVNSIYQYPNNMVFFTTPELLEIGDIPMTSLNDKPVRAEALKYYRRVADHYKLDIRQYVRVEKITGEDGAFDTYAMGDTTNCEIAIDTTAAQAHNDAFERLQAFAVAFNDSYLQAYCVARLNFWYIFP